VCNWCRALVPFVLDLRIAHERFGSSSDPSLHGHLHYQNNVDGTLNEATTDKIREYLSDCNNFMSPITSTSGCLHSEFVYLLFLQDHRETERFSAASEVQLPQSNKKFHYRVTFSSQLKSRVGNILDKTAALRVNLNIDGAPIASRSHTHPSHSQTSRLLTSSLSLGVQVPHTTQCM
jgi:hypothetical protein